MNFKLLHPADQIVTIMNRIYGYKMTTTSGGNLSIKDDNGDIWISPSGVDKGNLTRDDICRIAPDGIIHGPHKPSVELPLHSMIYKHRSDIKAVLHAHPPALVSFSIVRKNPNTSIIPNASQICGEVRMAKYDVPGSNALGANIVEEFKKGGRVVMLENHGVVVGHTDLFAAFMAFETLQFCAELEISAGRIGTLKPLTDAHLDISFAKNNAVMEEIEINSYSSAEREARANMCRLISRSYDQHLFSSTQGTFSQRIDNNNFIITPYGLDRKYISPADLVRIQGGKKEQGKNPSRSVLLHQHIYNQHPDINSVIIAHPPSMMAFAVSDATFDSRTIPESYIMLREVPKLPFGSSFMQPQLTAREINSRYPVVMVENDCIIAVGTSLLNAFDRLEVAEFSAKAIIGTQHLGNIIKISDAEVAVINRDFDLEE